MISDSHEGIKAAASKVLKATWQRCRVHFMRNALAQAGKTQRLMVSAAIGTVFVQESADAARTQWRSVADQLRGKFPKLNPLERLNAEIKRRTRVVVRSEHHVAVTARIYQSSVRGGASLAIEVQRAA